MKKIISTSLFCLTIFSFNVTAQEKIYRETTSAEDYGKTLNLALGVGYFGYVGHPIPVLHLNYELDVARNFTLAPFITFYTYRNGYYWGDNNGNHPYKNYYYSETVIPIGAKGTYYFDQLFRANSQWDFYVAGSLGFAIVISSWDDDYYYNNHLNGNRDYYGNSSSLYIALHTGAEYHLNNRLGLFLDLSTSVSTFGLAIH